MISFESRDANVQAGNETVFRFVTDMRNFERFVPRDGIRNWKAEKNSCTFDVPVAGKSVLEIASATPFSEVCYAGSGMNGTRVDLKITISNGSAANAVVKVFINADINPMLRTLISGPLDKFLNMIAGEMEKFDGWEETIE